jgi:hypothetical protein
VPDGGAVGDVDAGGAPALGRFGERRERAGRGLEAAEVGDAHGGELAGDPALPGEGFASGGEGAGVAVGALASAEPVLDQIAALTRAGFAAFDPDARHARA